jgi:hypothetical protein
MTKGVVSRSMSSPAETASAMRDDLIACVGGLLTTSHHVQTLFVTGLTVAHTVWSPNSLRRALQYMTMCPPGHSECSADFAATP